MVIKVEYIASTGFHENLTFSPCGGLNENAPHRFLHLNVWSLVAGTALGKISQCGLVGGCVSLGVGPDVSKVHASPSL